MKIRFELKHFDRDEANAFFCDIPAQDETPIIDLTSGNVMTCGEVAQKHPVVAGEGEEDFLILHHTDVKKAQKWWESLRRIEYNGVSYVVIKGTRDVVDSQFTGLALSDEDHKLYQLTWDPVTELAVPLLSPEHASLLMDPFPDYNWKDPIGLEPLD